MNFHFNSIYVFGLKRVYQYFALMVSITLSCSGPFLLAYFSIAVSGTPPNALARPVNAFFFRVLLLPVLSMNFWIPYLKLCCHVLYMTPSCGAVNSFPISKNS